MTVLVTRDKFRICVIFRKCGLVLVSAFRDNFGLFYSVHCALDKRQFPIYHVRISNISLSKDYRETSSYYYHALTCMATGVCRNSFICAVQKMKFSIKDFFSKCDQIRSFLRILSHLLKKSSMENFIFCKVLVCFVR